MMDFFIASNHQEPKTGFGQILDPPPDSGPPGFNDLPMEILLMIMDMISLEDRIAAGETCRRWLEAAHYYTPFNEQFVFRFSNINFSDYEPPLSYFLKGFRIFPRIEMSSVMFYGKSDFWPDFGEYIRDLFISNSNIQFEGLIWILQNSPNLCKLGLESCDELFKTWVFENSYCCKQSNFILENLVDVSLANNDFVNELQFNWIMTIAPNITHLNISNCFKMIPSVRRVAMVEHVMRLINNRKFQFQSLLFNGTLSMDDICLSTLALLDGLRLESLGLTFCDKIPVAIIDLLRRTPDLKITQSLQWKVSKTKKIMKAPGFISFISTQKYLEHLDLTSSLGITDEIMDLIINCLPRLRTLKVRRCILLTDEGIMNIVKLENLEVLDLSNCEKISDKAMFNGVVGRKIKRLKELYLCELPYLSDYTLIQVTLNFSMIQILDLSCTPNAASDPTMQYINFYLVHMRKLNLDSCNKISDAGITGIDLPYNPLEIWDISESFSITRLFKLRTLVLTGCYRVTDLSLQNAMHFGELKELHMARCYQITQRGIQALVENNRAIEYLDISGCPLVTDSCIDIITSTLKRLKTLRADKCPLLTNECFYFVSVNCQYLKHISLGGCLRLTRVKKRLSASVPTLHEIECDE
ncbi:uncharacterized protein LOC129742775 [Uranotaenia lowii]|uniref:uncharacterized protein LOC129742775 n=1 Tax=Uranotaenia lowii TaxID=190385 RepID=UPI00247893D4|nr:uncharacterized protein LOC129742775 [Uranotaenia lowii]